jgi:recombination protein RecA
MSLKTRLKTIGRIVNSLETQFGQGAIPLLDTTRKRPLRGTVSTGLPALDASLGVRGWPRSRITELFGPPGSGKTTLALHAVCSCQESGGLAAFLDVEHALDLTYAESVGVNLKELLLIRPTHGEQALDLVDSLVQQGVDLVVIDSVAALIPKEELNGTMEDQHLGGQALLMSQALRKIVGILHKHPTALLFTNQIRHGLDPRLGRFETTAGGNALKFYASLRVDLRRRHRWLEGERVVGEQIEANVIKNKLAMPFQSATLWLRHGQGFVERKTPQNHEEPVQQEEVTTLQQSA